jgi:hypothetical protein
MAQIYTVTLHFLTATLGLLFGPDPASEQLATQRCRMEHLKLMGHM